MGVHKRPPSHLSLIIRWLICKNDINALPVFCPWFDALHNGLLQTLPGVDYQILGLFRYVAHIKSFVQVTMVASTKELCAIAEVPIIPYPPFDRACVCKLYDL